MDEAAMSVGQRILNFDDPIGGGWVSLIVLTVFAFGFGALMMGRALADTWRPAWQTIAYGLLLGVANRLFHNFLASGDLLNLPAFVFHTAILVVIALVTYRATKAHKMVMQYPWLYARSGPLGWREIS